METQAEFHTREQQEAMLKAVKEPRHRVIILLMLDGGMRVSEARKRHWEECDFRAKVIKVNSLKKRENSRKKERIVPMSDRLYTAFDELLKEGVVPKGPIFPGSDDGYLGRSAVNMMLRRLEQKNPAIGETKPHKLRHTAATMLLANGGDLNQVKEFLGHEDVRVTQIYTHAQIEDIRTAINANAPKPTFFQRIRSKLFPQRHSVINLLIPDTDFVVGRDKEQKQIQSLVSRGINVLIAGEIGIGKTHLLQSLNFDKPTLVIDDCSDFKTSIKAAILHVCGDKETASAMLFQTKDLKAVDVKLSTASLSNLVQTLKDVTQPGEYLMKIGNIDGITPRVVKVLEELKDHFTIITTARSVKMEAASFAWSFEKLELKPLQRPDSLKMIYRLISDLQVSDLDAVMTKIYETADGNPRKIRELCDRLRREPFVNLDSVTEVADAYLGRQVEEFDFSVILLVILGGFVLLRYVGRETGEKDLQFIGACIMLVMMFARYFFRSAKRRTL